MKYTRNIVTETKPLPREVIESFMRRGPVRSTVKIERLLYLDKEVVDGAFYMEVTLCHEGTSEDFIEDPHIHDADEIIAFIGTDPNDPWNLNSEIELWLNDKLYTINRSCLVFIPRGLKHCPIRFKMVGKPLWFMTLSPMSMYTRKVMEKSVSEESARNLEHLIVSEMKKRGLPQPPKELPGTVKMNRILYLDDEIVEGAFYMECVWFGEGVGSGSPPPHTHEFDEVLGFLGSDPNRPRELNGEVELWIDDEKHILTKSCLIFIPRGVKHCPMIFRKVDKPILHFSTGPSGKYERMPKIS
ncbi:MAG: hypothetical protein QXJ19_02010 [Candidatus Bathyarchaeia archaeon]|nr:hypothetical protein [Candidatus Bathyarchaeota archaeon]